MKTFVKSTIHLILFTAILFFGSCSSSTSPYGGNSNNSNNSNLPANTIGMANMAFGPSGLTVAKGTTVTWKNNDSVAHTATSDAGTWDTGNIAPGGSKSVTFNSAGTFTYHCTVHPMMTASIVVQ
jgi:plastocyanin